MKIGGKVKRLTLWRELVNGDPSEWKKGEAQTFPYVYSLYILLICLVYITISNLLLRVNMHLYIYVPLIILSIKESKGLKHISVQLYD